MVAVDGTTGEVVVDPRPQALARFRARAARWPRAAARRARDGRRTGRHRATATTVLVGANLGSVADARVAAERGADLAGLVRTEFLFLGPGAAPDVDEQEAAYRAIAEALGGRRITLRTLDVGGDKPLPYLPMPAEANPFLGRARHAARRWPSPELLADQLRGDRRGWRTTTRSA